MRLQIGLSLAVLVTAVGCGPAPVKCGQEICTAEQRCTGTTCVLDTPPKVNIESPDAGAVIITTKVEVRGSATDDDTGLKVEASSNGSNWVPVTTTSDGTFSLPLTLPMLDSTGGQVLVRATDSKGRVTKVSRTISVDNMPPTCAITGPMDGTVLSGTGSVMVTMTAADGSLMLAKARVSTDGAVTFATLTEMQGAYSFPWVLTSENGVTHDLVFRVEDVWGHGCEARAKVTIDNVKPTVSITAPTSGQLLSAAFFSGGGTFRGNASDGSRLLKSVTVDFGVGPVNANINADTWSVAVPAPLNDDYKTRLATVLATDQANNTATATVNVLVDVKPPTLSILTPSQNAKLNVSNFTSSNNAPLTWMMTDGDSTLTIGLVQPDGGLLVPPVVPTSVSDNPKAYQATLRASDRAGNATLATVSFSVDRVVPTVVSYAPTNNTRMFAGNTSADFSEPMMGGNGLNLNPNNIGAWSSPTHFAVSGLLQDAVYTAQTGTVTDLHGNPVVPFSYRFHTAPWRPVSGALLFNGYDVIYAATTDVEGTIYLLARPANTNVISLLALSPSDGSPKVLDTFNSGAVGLLVAGRTVQPDLTSRRLVGVTANAGTGDQVHYSVDAGTAVIAPGAAEAFIPTAAFAGEGNNLADYGFIAGGLYKRAGRANVSLAMTAVDGISVSATHWQLQKGNNGGSDSQDFGCSLPGPVCGVTAFKSLGGGSVGAPNAAISQFCSIHGYQNGGLEKTTLFRFQPQCGGMMNPCASDTTEDNNFDQVVADPNADGTFYGFNILGNGDYQLKKRVLSPANCTGAITDVPGSLSLPSLPTGTFGRLVVLDGAPGLVYGKASGFVGSVYYIAP